MKRSAALLIAVVLAACGGSEGGDGNGATVPEKPTTVTLTGFEFGYEAPDGLIPAGPIESVLVNEGKQPHQAILYRLNDGIDFDTFKTKVMKDDSVLPDLATGGTDGVSEIASPGDRVSSTGDAVDPGTYAYICFVRDQSGKTSKNHAELGMIAPLRVE